MAGNIDMEAAGIEAMTEFHEKDIFDGSTEDFIAWIHRWFLKTPDGKPGAGYKNLIQPVLRMYKARLTKV